MPPRVMRLALPFLGVIAVLGVIAAFAWRSPQREPDRRPGVAACPGAYPQGPRPKATRDGDLVARGASVALLCRYPFPNNALGGSTPLAAEDVPRLVERLNGLADARAVESSACLLAGREEYQVALGYPDGTKTLVTVHANCGVVSSTGAVRLLRSLDQIVGLWPAA